MAPRRRTIASYQDGAGDPRREGGVPKRRKAHGSCLKRCTALILLGSRRLRINWTRKGTNAVLHQNIVFHALLKHIPWAAVDRLVEQHDADRDPRALKTKLI